MKRTIAKYLAFAGCVLLGVGCELPDEGETAGSSGGDSDWASIQWRGEAFPNAVQVMTLSASTSANHVHFNWDSWPWGGSMGLGHFFVWNGSAWVGGKFEWIRASGQATKLLENIRNGYNGLSAPASGTTVAFAWTNASGTQRSNLAVTTWP